MVTPINCEYGCLPMTKLTLSLPILALSIAASTAYAGGVSPFYIGAGIGSGYNNVEDDAQGCGNTATNGGINTSKSCEDNDTTYQVYGGFHFSEGISVEAGYANLGNTLDVNTQLTNKGTGQTIDLHDQQGTGTIFAAGVARMPLGKASPVSVYGKAGVHRWNSELEYQAVSNNTGKVATFKAEDSGVSPLVGAGIEYDVSEGATLRAGWDRYYSVGENRSLTDGSAGSINDVKTFETDVDVFSAGLNYYFL